MLISIFSIELTCFKIITCKYDTLCIAKSICIAKSTFGLVRNVLVPFHWTLVSPILSRPTHHHTACHIGVLTKFIEFRCVPLFLGLPSHSSDVHPLNSFFAFMIVPLQSTSPPSSPSPSPDHLNLISFTIQVIPSTSDLTP